MLSKMIYVYVLIYGPCVKQDTGSNLTCRYNISLGYEWLLDL